MYCPFCGKKLPDIAVYCNSCGKQIKDNIVANKKPMKRALWLKNGGKKEVAKELLVFRILLISTILLFTVGFVLVELQYISAINQIKGFWGEEINTNGLMTTLGVILIWWVFNAIFGLLSLMKYRTGFAITYAISSELISFIFFASIFGSGKKFLLQNLIFASIWLVIMGLVIFFTIKINKRYRQYKLSTKSL